MRIEFDAEPAVAGIQEGPDAVRLPVPRLAGPQAEIFPVSVPLEPVAEGCRLARTSELSFGIASVPVDDADCAERTRVLFRSIFDAVGDRQMYRMWNFLPDINAGEGDRERYKQFCLGRSAAFAETFGTGYTHFMPAGTCVGSDGRDLAVYFLAGDASPVHHENERQVPAYRYPRSYGPCSPSFARATTVHFGDAHHRFVSGTSAIIGHASQGSGNLAQQLYVTCENLALVEQKTRPHGFAETATSVAGKVYLRRADDLDACRDYLGRHYPQWSESLIYLRADICRRELQVEIELTLSDG